MLMEQLSSLQQATHEIALRLQEFGYGHAADAILGTPEQSVVPPRHTPPPPQQSPPLRGPLAPQAPAPPQAPASPRAPATPQAPGHRYIDTETEFKKDEEERKQRPPKIKGTLYDAESAEPLSQGTVRIDRYTIACDTEGNFELTLPKHGTYEIRASAMLYADAEPVEVDTTDDEALEVEIMLMRTEMEMPEPQETGEQRYLLAGASIFLPYQRSLEDLYRTMIDVWIQAGIGAERIDGKPSEPIPPYAPDAIIRGTEIDPGQRIPREALRSETAFVAWGQNHGLAAGASIEVDGLLSAPGRPIVAAVERKHSSGQ